MNTNELQLTIANALNQYFFYNVWNEPASEFRSNVIPQMLYERSINSQLFIFDQYIDLPNTLTSFYILVTSFQVTHGLSVKVLPETWLSTTTLLNDYNINFNMYHLDGRVLHKDYVYLYKLKDSLGYLIAIDKKMTDKCKIKPDQIKNLRFTIYYDSDLTNEISVKSIKVPDIDRNFTKRNEIYNYYLSCTHAGIEHVNAYINGNESTIIDAGSMNEGDYIDIIHDENILISFNVDLTSIDQDFIFFSNKDKTYKQIVHIPKNLNPDNKVFTHNTIDIHVRKKEVNENGLIIGRYLHRCAERSVTQITHNDYGIPMFIIDAYRDYLDTQDVTLQVVIRQHDKDNILIRDKSYIDLLYTLNDDLILQHLSGKIELPELSFWTANELENSVYVNMMFDVPDIVTTDNMFTYIEGLGYYRAIALICKRIIHINEFNHKTTSFSFNKPYIYQNKNVYPVLYKNGYKVKDTDIKILNIDSNLLGIKLLNGVNYNATDKLTVETFITGHNKSYRFTPTTDTTTITVPFTDYLILEEKTDKYRSWTKYGKTSNKTYSIFNPTIGQVVAFKNNDGTLKLIFASSLYDRTFIVQNKECTHNNYKEIDTNLVNNDPIFINVESAVFEGRGDAVPVWFTPHISVYLNGKYLVKNIDYTLLDVDNDLGLFSFKSIVIHNLEYLKNSGNYVEWIITTAENESLKSGFVIDHKIQNEDNSISLYFDEMSMVHVDGKSTSEIIDKGIYLELPDDPVNYRQGGVFDVRTSIPKIIKDFINEFHINDDFSRLSIINNYLYSKNRPRKDIVVLPHSHRIYSSYLAAILRDATNGTLTNMSLDPDASKLMSQLPQYKYLYNTDIVVQGKFNITFIDAFPTYTQLVVPNPELYKILQNFIKYIMPEDNLTSGEIYY